MGRTSTARKSRPRDAATKVAEHRLSVLELARELGNVAEACRRAAWTGPVFTSGNGGFRPMASRG